MGDRHLAQHPHDEDHEQACGKIGEHGGRPGLVDHGARADEQPGTDHPAQRDHRHVAALEAALEPTAVLDHAHGLPAHRRHPSSAAAVPRQRRRAAGRGRGALRRRAPGPRRDRRDRVLRGRGVRVGPGVRARGGADPRGGRREIPFLGVCLGAQLLALAHGGEVSRLAPARDLGAAERRRRDPIVGALPPGAHACTGTRTGSSRRRGPRRSGTPARRPGGRVPPRPPRVGRPVPSGDRPGRARRLVRGVGDLLEPAG